MAPDKVPGQDAVRAHLRTAVDAATRSASEGGGPFGAVLVTRDGQQFVAVNRVTVENDPTAHAEIAAIRAAATTLGTHDLSEATLYVTCEPCPMCVCAALWARLNRICFAADRHDAARGGFDDAAFHDFFTASQEQRDAMLPLDHVSVAHHDAPFEAWAANSDRTDY